MANAKLVMDKNSGTKYAYRANEVWTKHKLLSLLTYSSEQYTTIKGITGVVQSIQREDGSGSSFNVQLLVGCGLVSVYVRTID